MFQINSFVKGEFCVTYLFNVIGKFSVSGNFCVTGRLYV